MTQEYSAYIAKISQSGRDGDDDTLYNKPAFFAEMHELKQAKARHSPPAVLSSSNDMTEAGLSLSSSRKRMKLSSSSMLECYIEEQKGRHEELIAEIRKGNEEKAKMRSVIERLVEKL